MTHETERRQYKCVIKQTGWSYAVPYLYVLRRSWFGFVCWTCVFEGDSDSLKSAERMHKQSVINWVIKTVEQYEDYEDSWRQA